MMISNEIIYGGVLLFSIAVGFLLRTLKSAKLKQVFTGGIGFWIACGICQYDVLHSLIAFMGNIIIIKTTKKHTSILSFLWCFLYLLFFRCCTYFDLPKPSPLANAIQLLLTLKLVSVAMEISDFRNEKIGLNEASTKFQLKLEKEPSIFDMLCYAYCYTGLFTGPFFKYKTYQDYLDTDLKTTRQIQWKEEIYLRLQKSLVFAVLYLLVAYYYNTEYAKSEEFYTRSIWYRVWYMVPIFFLGRMRFYTAWLLAECSFVTLTLGAYPKSSLPRPGHGPTVKLTSDNGYFSFETIRNIDPYGCDFSPTVRLGMRNWNMSVQWWLANYVHKRWPNYLKNLKIAGVMAVSAYWHGIDPGFFGAFLTMPLIMVAEDFLGSLIKKRIPAWFHNTYDWFNWFAKMRCFEYMYMAFVLLTWQDTYRYWSSVCFWLHISSIITIIICLILKSLLKSSVYSVKRNEDKKQKQK